jgi:hypothetical protein
MAEPEPVSVGLTSLLASGVGDRGAQWFASNLLGEDGEPVVNRQAAWKLLTTPRTGWVQPNTMRAISHLFGWQHATVYIANAVSLGLNPPTGGSALASILPEWTGRLPVGDQLAVRDVVLRFGDARGLTT